MTTASIEEQVRLAEDFLQGLLSELGAQATITSSELTNELVELRIEGGGLGTLIGPKGTTLLALQELTRTVLQRQASPSDCRLVIDVNGYRRRRQEALARFAQNVAAEVKTSNVKRALEPMPPSGPESRARRDQHRRRCGDDLGRRGAIPSCRRYPVRPLTPHPSVLPRPLPSTQPSLEKKTPVLSVFAATGCLVAVRAATVRLSPALNPPPATSRPCSRRSYNQARRFGFLGPGPVTAQMERSLAFAKMVTAAPQIAVDLGSGGGLPGSSLP